MKLVQSLCVFSLAACASSFADENFKPSQSLDDIEPLKVIVVDAVSEKPTVVESLKPDDTQGALELKREERVTAASSSNSTYHEQASNQSDAKDFLSNYKMLKGKMLTPTAVATTGYGFSLSADFIYWYAREEGLDYARTGAVPVASFPVAANALAQGASYSPDFKVKPGFKAAIGYQMDYDSWDLNLNYTWLHSRASDSKTFGANEVALPLWETRSAINIGQIATLVFDGSGTTLNSAKASWKLHFNVMNFELGRNFFVSPKLTLRPHFGLKGSWQTQRYSMDYNGTGVLDADLVFFEISTPIQELYKVRYKQHFWGLGLRFGLDSSWLFSRSWSLFGNLAITPLWGQFTVVRKDSVDLPALETFGTEMLNTKSRSHTIIPVLEMMMGFRYDNWFSNDSMRFRLEIGWEEQHWLSQNRFKYESADAMFGSLVFQGLTVKARFDF